METVARGTIKQLRSAQTLQVSVEVKGLQSAVDTDSGSFPILSNHFEGLTMIRRAPSKKHVLLKRWKSAVGVLTIFCQHYFFTLRSMVIYKWE